MGASVEDSVWQLHTETWEWTKLPPLPNSDVGPTLTVWGPCILRVSGKYPGFVVTPMHACLDLTVTVIIHRRFHPLQWVALRVAAVRRDRKAVGGCPERDWAPGSGELVVRARGTQSLRADWL